MTGQTYRAGIIGTGFIGGADQVSGDALGQQVSHLDGTHVDIYTRHPRVALVAGSSRDPGRRARFEARTGARVYDDWKRMLSDEALDIVSVSTYTDVRAEITIACAERGARVIYAEKPIAQRLADAERMLEACDASGSLLAVNHNRRYNPNFHRLKDWVACGRLGELRSAGVRWTAGRFGNVGTHMIDAVRMLTGREVLAVSGTLDPAGKPDCRGPRFRDPGGWGVMRLDGGLMVTVDAADWGVGPAWILLNGSEGWSVLSGLDDVVIEFLDGRKTHWPPSTKETTSMDRALDSIIAWLDEGTPFPCPPEESVRTLEAILAFHASDARNGAWVALPLEGADRARRLRSG